MNPRSFCPNLPRCWDYRCGSPHSAVRFLYDCGCQMSTLGPASRRFSEMAAPPIFPPWLSLLLWNMPCHRQSAGQSWDILGAEDRHPVRPRPCAEVEGPPPAFSLAGHLSLVSTLPVSWPHLIICKTGRKRIGLNQFLRTLLAKKSALIEGRGEFDFSMGPKRDLIPCGGTPFFLLP